MSTQIYKTCVRYLLSKSLYRTIARKIIVVLKKVFQVLQHISNDTFYNNFLSLMCGEFKNTVFGPGSNVSLFYEHILTNTFDIKKNT